MNLYSFPDFRAKRGRLDENGGTVRPYHVKVAATAKALPTRVVTNEDIIGDYGHRVAASVIHKMQGVVERRVAAHGVVDTDLLLQAATICLQRAEIRPEQLSKLIVTKFLGDRVLPMCASLLQKKLACPVAIQAFDVDGGIHSFLSAFDTALCAIESGDGPILIASGGVINRLISRTDPRLAFLFGDGAAAVLLTPSEHPHVLASYSFSNYAYTESARGFEMRECVSEDMHATKAYDSLFNLYRDETWKQSKDFVVEAMSKTARSLLTDAGKGAEEIDLWLITENHHRLRQAIIERLGIPSEKTVSLLSKYGNTMSAMLPMLLDEAIQEGRVRKGNTVLMLSVGEGICGGGVLFTL